MGQGGNGAGAMPIDTGGTGSLSNSQYGLGNAFDKYEAQNDSSMGLDKLSSQYADQKGGGSGIDWRSKIKDGLLGMAETKLNDLNQFNSAPMTTQAGGFTQTPDAKGQSYNSSNYYNQLMQQQFANWQAMQIPRYKRGVINGR